MVDSKPHNTPDETPLYDYIDMEVYDVVPGPKYRALLEQFEAAVTLAEKYGDAIVRISEALRHPTASDNGRINRAQVIIAGLESNPAYIAEFIGESLAASNTLDRKSEKTWGPERMRHDPL
jgi:hypothetical protein